MKNSNIEAIVCGSLIKMCFSTEHGHLFKKIKKHHAVVDDFQACHLNSLYEFSRPKIIHQPWWQLHCKNEFIIWNAHEIKIKENSDAYHHENKLWASRKIQKFPNTFARWIKVISSDFVIIPKCFLFIWVQNAINICSRIYSSKIELGFSHHMVNLRAINISCDATASKRIWYMELNKQSDRSLYPL